MPYFDRFDVCEAWTLFLAEWHDGRAGYAAFSVFVRVQFRPAPGLDRASLSENGRAILAQLIRRARRGENVWRRNRGNEYRTRTEVLPC